MIYRFVDFQSSTFTPLQHLLTFHYIWRRVLTSISLSTYHHFWLCISKKVCSRQYSPWNSPGQNTGVGSCSLLQGIFSTQGSNPGLPHCRRILYQLSHKGSPRILEWVAYPFSRGSSQPRNQTRFSCIAGIFFINWAIREACSVTQSCPTLWDPMDCSLPGSSVHGVF